MLERGLAPHLATREIDRLIRMQRDFPWLDPPDSLGDVTVLDVLAAVNTSDHAERTERWARSVWDAWSPHHATVRGWPD